MKTYLSLKFYLAEGKAKSNKIPIYLRMTYARKKAELFTGLVIESKHWNPGKQRTKNDNQVDDKLSTIESELHNILYILEKEKKHITPTIIKHIYTGKNQLELSLLAYYDSHIQSLKTKNELAKGSISSYEATYDHLKQFLSECDRTDIPISKVDFKLLNDFDVYLKSQKVPHSEKLLERNTVNKHHSRLRPLLIKAVKESQLAKNPYNDFALKYTPSKRTFLTLDELEAIKKHDLGNNQSLMKVRDIFMFSVYTGLRFQDAQNLKTHQIVKDNKGNFHVSIYQDKTDEGNTIPLLKPAIEIIKKYEQKESNITGFVLPKISNQKTNSYLKVIGDLTNIEKPLTHHVARHTYATTILLSNDVPMAAISQLLGHKKITTTQIYAKITNPYLQKVVNQIADKI